MKKIWLFFLLFIFSLFLPFTALANDAFTTSSNVTYEVNNQGLTTVTHNITLENAVSDLYATSYVLSLEGAKPVNPQAYEGTTPLPLVTSQNGDKTTLKVNFPDAVVGKGKQRNFYLTFQDSSLATKTGEVWEITIPKLSDTSSYNNYTVTLVTPISLGAAAYISPQSSSKSQD